MRAFTVRLNDEDARLLEKLCRKTGLIPTVVIRQLIHAASENPSLIRGEARIQVKSNFTEELGFLAHRDHGIVFFRGKLHGKDCLALSFQRALSYGESLSVRMPGEKIERFREICKHEGLPGYLFFMVKFHGAGWKYCLFHLEQLEEESCFSFSKKTGNYHLLLNRVPDNLFADNLFEIVGRIIYEEIG